MVVELGHKLQISLIMVPTHTTFTKLIVSLLFRLNASSERSVAAGGDRAKTSAHVGSLAALGQNVVELLIELSSS